MSATVGTNTSSWRKRHREEDKKSPMDLPRPRYYYYRLESESSKASEEDTESVYSLQDRETDIARDTTDTDSKSSCSDQDEYAVIEYEVASLSESDNGSHVSSSGSENMMLAAAVEAICDTSLEKWITDGEDSDNSSLDGSAVARSDFSTCVQCRSENDNPLYRYCEKCFQQSCRQCKMRKTYKCFPLCISCYKDRKRFFPPRPRGNRKSKKAKKKLEPPVQLDALRSCLSGLSQDSGIGSSQECPQLDLDQIIVPDKHLKPGTSSQIPTTTKASVPIQEPSKTVQSLSVVDDVKTVDSSSSFSSTDKSCNLKRKRQISESSLSDYEISKSKQVKIEGNSISLIQTSSLGSDVNSGSFSTSNMEKVSALGNSTESSELCIFCHNAPKDTIFMHTNIAHQCCCYKCAKRTLNTIKRCPICNRPVNKIVRVYKY